MIMVSFCVMTHRVGRNTEFKSVGRWKLTCWQSMHLFEDTWLLEKDCNRSSMPLELSLWKQLLHFHSAGLFVLVFLLRALQFYLFSFSETLLHKGVFFFHCKCSGKHCPSHPWRQCGLTGMKENVSQISLLGSEDLIEIYMTSIGWMRKTADFLPIVLMF